MGQVRAHHLGTLLTPVLALGLASTALLGVPSGTGGDTSRPPFAGGSAAVAEPAVVKTARGVRLVETGLDAAALRAHHGATGVLRPGTFSQVAVTWHGTAPAVRVSTHTAGEWTDWKAIETLDDL